MESSDTPSDAPGPGEGQQPSQEELRAQLEEQLRSVRVQDLVLESAASIVNLTARRIAKDDERDLEQARVGIDAARALVDLIDEQAQGQVRDALSQLQMLYAQHAGGGEDGGEEGTGSGGAGGPSRPSGSGLWTPGG